LDEEIKKIISCPDTIISLATAGADGSVHSAFKNSFRARGDGNLEYDEVIETSRTNGNLVYSIWFGKTVSISALAKNLRAFLITGRPVRAIISGREFRERYVAIREKLGDVDLAATWVIEPLSVAEQTFEKRRAEEEEAHPLLRHLDRLIVPGGISRTPKEG
jgi:hypothetical protein